MNGIHAAFTGRIGEDAEIRATRDGKPWAAFPVAPNSATLTHAAPASLSTLVSTDTVDALAPRLTKGAEIYCEGRLTLRPWTDAEGKARAGGVANTTHGPDRAAEGPRSNHAMNRKRFAVQ